jgi:hypothetical protein
VTLLRGFFTADVTVLFELERLLARLETESFAARGKPLPEKLARSRHEMQTLLGIATSSTHGSPGIEASVVCSATNSTTIGTMQTSKILGLSPQRVRQRCTDGSLPAVQNGVNGSWRILKASVLEERRNK